MFASWLKKTKPLNVDGIFQFPLPLLLGLMTTCFLSRWRQLVVVWETPFLFSSGFNNVLKSKRLIELFPCKREQRPLDSKAFIFIDLKSSEPHVGTRI